MPHIYRHALLMLAASAMACLQAATAGKPAATTLREAFADDFLVGVALNSSQVGGRNKQAGEIAARQFSSITAENDMKWQSLHPQPGRYRFDAADVYFEFAQNMA